MAKRKIYKWVVKTHPSGRVLSRHLTLEAANKAAKKSVNYRVFKI